VTAGSRRWHEGGVASAAPPSPVPGPLTGTVDDTVSGAGTTD